MVGSPDYKAGLPRLIKDSLSCRQLVPVSKTKQNKISTALEQGAHVGSVAGERSEERLSWLIWGR